VAGNLGAIELSDAARGLQQALAAGDPGAALQVFDNALQAAMKSISIIQEMGHDDVPPTAENRGNCNSPEAA
jgi:hypothetical protein